MWLILVCLLVAGGPAAKKKASPVMQIKFVRSGGFAGAATNVAGTVEFGEQGAQVHAEATDYHRELAPQEGEQLRADADPGALANAAVPATGAVRDGYQYDIAVVTKDGKSHSLTLRQGDKATRLGSWIQDEAEKIWRYRVAARKLPQP